MSLWKKTMDYLGLGPDDAYDDYDEPMDEPPARSSRGGRDVERSSSRGGPARGWDEPDDSGAVRAVPARPSFPSRDFDSNRRDESVGAPRPSREASPRNHQPQQGPAPRSTPPPPAPAGEPATVRPRRFDQAQELADRFKEGLPVILNLESTDRDVARRLIDFASGLCYAMDGSMEKVATGVYLLKPAPVRSRIDDYDH